MTPFDADDILRKWGGMDRAEERAKWNARRERRRAKRNMRATATRVRRIARIRREAERAGLLTLDVERRMGRSI